MCGLLSGIGTADARRVDEIQSMIGESMTAIARDDAWQHKTASMSAGAR